MTQFQQEINKVMWSGYYEPDIKGIRIKFELPIELPIQNTKDQKRCNKILQNSNQEMLNELIEEKLQSAIQSKYISKLNDSYNTFIRILSFNKILKNISKKQEIKFDEFFFDDFKNLNLKLSDTEFYTNEYMQYRETINGINREIIKEYFEIIVYLTTNNKPEELGKKYKNNNKYKVLKQAYNDYKKDFYITRFTTKFSKDDFQKMLIETNCSYCAISLKKIELLRNSKKISSKSGRGFSLEIDRKEANLEYTKDNCCMSCYWCNNAKTDEFSVNEFKEIARGINAVWNQRLKKAGIEKIEFPSEIWENHKL